MNKQINGLETFSRDQKMGQIKSASQQQWKAPSNIIS
jgi:hypothetical protein